MKERVLSFYGSLLCVFLYAIADELHQKFTGGRTPLLQDVILDTFGGVMGILCFIMVSRWRRHPA